MQTREVGGGAAPAFPHSTCNYAGVQLACNFVFKHEHPLINLFVKSMGGAREKIRGTELVTGNVFSNKVVN
jgi:hypothetical protein